METKEFKNTKGITLISLVVSIVVLLILSGVAIVTLTGENSIISRTTQAKETTAKSEFLERAKLAYADIFIEETADLKTPAITLAKIKKKLNDEQPGSVKGTGTYEITGVKYNGQEVEGTLKVPDDGEITLQVETDTVSEDSKFYGFVQGKYYEILLENSEIKLGEEKALSEIEAGAIASELTATLEKESGATTNVDIVVDKNQKEVKIKGKGVNTGRGAGTVKISYGNTRNIGIDVVETFTVTVQAEQENDEPKGTIISPSVATQKYASGSVIILQTTANDGLKLKDWYDGTNVVGETNQCNYTISKNATITARYEIKRKYGQNSNLGKIIVNGTELQSKWKYFLEDNDSIYLMYGDYLENGAIPLPVSENSTIMKVGRSVKSTSSKNDLLEYLEGSGSYTTIWNSLNTEIKEEIKSKIMAKGKEEAEANELVEGIITKGGANPKQWVDSFNENYFTKLEAENFQGTEEKIYYNGINGNAEEVDSNELKTNKEGYLYTRNSLDSPIKWEDLLNSDFMLSKEGYPGQGNEGNMYYPKTSIFYENSKLTSGYWLTRIFCKFFWCRMLLII